MIDNYLHLKYGTINLYVRDLDLTFRVVRKIRLYHFLDTNRNKMTQQGLGPTEISGKFILYSQSDKKRLEDYIYAGELQEFHLTERFYKDVGVAEDVEFQPITHDGRIFEANVKFLALDPIPYSVHTGEALF